jgi:hypothetical protein
MAYLGSRCTRPSTFSAEVGTLCRTSLVGSTARASGGFTLGAALAPPAAVQASLEDSLTQLTLRPFDSATCPDPDATNGPVDLILAAGEGPGGRCLRRYMGLRESRGHIQRVQ